VKKFNEFIIEYKISLQEKRKAKREPGASNEKPTGSTSKGTYKSSPEGQKRYKAAKVDIEVKQGLRDAGASGDFSPTMSPEARKKAQAIRDARMKKLATPDPFDDDYAKKTGNVDKRTKVGKKIGSAFETPKKPTTKAPPGDFGPGDTKGQMNVKGMDRRAFKITKPEDIKKTAGYKPFAKLSRDIQDYKDRDVPGGPRKTGGTSFRGSPSGSRFDPDIGMAPDDSAARRQKKVEDILDKVKKKQKGYSFKNKPTPGSEPVVFKEPFNNKKKVRVTSNTGSTGTTQPSTRKYNFARDGVTGTSSDSAKKAYKDFVKGATNKTSTAYKGIYGKKVDTVVGRAQFDARKAKRMSKLRYKGLGGKPSLQPGRRLIKPLIGAAKKNPKAAIGLAVLGTIGTIAGVNKLRPKKAGPLNAFRNSTYDKTVYHAKGPKAGKPVQYTYRAKNSSINPPGIGKASKPQTQRTLNKGIKSGEFKLK
tara:strand:- start:68 stop:1495 length:1428 start_codon:yes stop_codon:yes gene_type:complete